MSDRGKSRRCILDFGPKQSVNGDVTETGNTRTDLGFLLGQRVGIRSLFLNMLNVRCLLGIQVEMSNIQFEA